TLTTSDTTHDGTTTTDATGGASTSTGDGTTASSTTSRDTLDTTTETTGFLCAPGPVEGGVECEPPGASIGYYQILTEPPAGACTLLSSVDDGVEIQTLTLQCGGSDPFDLEIHTAAPHVPVPVSEG